MNLFMTGDFTLNSGAKSPWKIECDALTKEDWEGLAAMARQFLPKFSAVVGVPRGGIPFADALRQYATGDPAHPVLIAEDVCTTGGSIRRFRKVLEEDPQTVRPSWGYIGVCVFARMPEHLPYWVTALFRMPEEKK